MKNKHNHISFIALFFLASLFLPSCYLLEPPTNSNADIEAVAATVVRLHLDGCNWMLALESGKSLEPSGIPAEYLQEGLKVWVKYIPRDGMSVCMAGQMVTVTEIKLRE